MSVRMGSPIPLEICRMADSAKNNPGQWKFIGIEGMYQRSKDIYYILSFNIKIYKINNSSIILIVHTLHLCGLLCNWKCVRLTCWPRSMWEGEGQKTLKPTFLIFLINLLFNNLILNSILFMLLLQIIIN